MSCASTWSLTRSGRVWSTARCWPRLYLSRRWVVHQASGAVLLSSLRRQSNHPAWRPAGHRSQSTSSQDYAASSFASCPGCGAPVQTRHPGQAGYYSLDRRSVARFVATNAGDLSESAPASAAASNDSSSAVSSAPVCDRCHGILHHSQSDSAVHPPVSAIEEYISASSFSYNHIYHIIDAVDFPMSLVRTIYKDLALAAPRSKNRRAKHATFCRGRMTELSFVITRADLLAPTKAHVDKLLPYLVEVLRSQLGSRAQNVRLGNVRCVSAKRGWWTRNIKSDIWDHGGAGWLVGKANVGKSSLFETIFPKGSVPTSPQTSSQTLARALQEASSTATSTSTPFENALTLALPPTRPEEAYPQMPTVSSLPGTTASPIRVPFGGQRGELVDLPGLARSNLELYVLPEQRSSLIMTSRIAPEQYIIKPGQSLLLGGLVRITPVDQDITVLGYPFVPLKPHITSTQKALEMEGGQRDPMMPLVVTKAAFTDFKSAGRFALQWDVTKQRAGPLVAKSAIGLLPAQLSFKVLSADIVIESLGWIELICQIPRARENAASCYPEVEVYTPSGQFTQARKPMGAWLLSEKAPVAKSRRSARPRKSMAGAKARAKAEARQKA